MAASTKMSSPLTTLHTDLGSVCCVQNAGYTHGFSTLTADDKREPWSRSHRAGHVRVVDRDERPDRFPRRSRPPLARCLLRQQRQSCVRQYFWRT